MEYESFPPRLPHVSTSVGTPNHWAAASVNRRHIHAGAQGHGLERLLPHPTAHSHGHDRERNVYFQGLTRSSSARYPMEVVGCSL